MEEGDVESTNGLISYQQLLNYPMPNLFRMLERTLIYFLFTACKHKLPSISKIHAACVLKFTLNHKP